MSYTNETTHFSIPLPLGSDLTTPMDYNTAAAAVDAALFEAQTNASQAVSDASNAVDTANQAASDVGDLGGNVNTLTGRVTALEQSDIIQDNKIGNLEIKMPTKFDSVGVADAYVDGLTYDIGDVVTYNGQRYVCNTAITAAEPFDADKWTARDIQAEFDQINSELNKYHRRVAYYMNTTNKTYAQCLTEICDQLDALQLDDEQVANLCLEVGLENNSFNLYRCVRHNKANGYYCFVGFSAGATAAMIYNGHTTASGATTTVVERTLASGTENDISSATNSTEWRVYV